MVFYDLNVPWPVEWASQAVKTAAKAKGKAVANEAAPKGVGLLQESNLENLSRCLEMLIQLNYSVCALNLFVPLNAFQSATARNLQPCPGLKPPLPNIDTRTAPKDAREKILQLSRLTIALDEKSISGTGNGSSFTSANASVLAQFDLIAAQPLDAASFQYACTQLSSPSSSSIDIITLDLASTPKLPFHFKRSLVLNAIQQGVVFEIVYGITLRTSSSSVPKDARRNVFASAKELIRITKGKGIIFSSAVQNCMELRQAPDIINLAHVCMGMEPSRAKDALDANARQAVLRGHSNRATYKSTIKGPKMVTEPLTLAAVEVQESNVTKSKKRTVEEEAEGTSKRQRLEISDDAHSE